MASCRTYPTGASVSAILTDLEMLDEKSPRLRVGLMTLAAVVGLAMWSPIQAHAAGTASDGPGNGAAWTTGNKVAVGTSADTTSKVWFTVAKGITTEVFYPRLDVPNMQDMQYIVTDGSTF